MFVPLKTITIFFVIFPQLFSQQIFEEKFSSCTFKNKELSKTERILKMDRKIWQITGKRRDKDAEVKFSVCDLTSPLIGCASTAAICILNKKKPEKNILNAGEYFIYAKDTDEDNGNAVLKSVNGQQCDEGENFTVIIQFSNSPDMSLEPRIEYMNECQLKIEMLHPSVSPYCTLKRDGNIIDLRPLKKIPDISISHPEAKTTFSLSICKKSASCGDDVAVCDIMANNSTVPISDVISQRITYERDSLIIKGNFGETKRYRKYYELNIKCNWKIKELGNLQYVKPQTQGRTYKFKGESSYACIKLPMNCMIRDKNTPYFLYDLRSLYKDSVKWVVKKVDGGKININVCGPLHRKNSGNDCFDQYSEVCNINDTGQIQNLGSISKNVHVTTSDTVKSSFEDGSVCLKNSSFTYSTEIEFICNSIEEGPVLDWIDECTYKIKWHTPAACPKHSPYGDNCLISDMTGSFNLNKMYTFNDSFIALSTNTRLRYNLCGPLRQPCNNVEDSGVCYMENNKEFVVGYSNKILTMDNGAVTLNMAGDKCGRKMSNTKFNFHCDHLAPQEGRVTVNIIRDKCEFLLIIETPLACPPSSYSRFSNNNFLSDLTLLSRNDSNYILKDNENIYILNVFRSVIKKDNMLCAPYSAICMENVTEPHLKKKYLSLGRINEDVAPTYDQQDLLIAYKFGSYCPESSSLDHSSTIRFQCSKKNDPPELLKKDVCHHEFIWRTIHACLKQSVVKPRAVADVPCEFIISNSTKIDLSGIKTKMKLTRSTGTYVIGLCSSVYTFCSGLNGANCTSKNAKVTHETKLGQKNIFYHLSDRCSNDDRDLHMLQFHLICEPLNKTVVIEAVNITHCNSIINLKSQLLCTDEELRPPVKDSPSSKQDTQTERIPPAIKDLPALNTVIQETQTTQNPLCLISEMNNFDLGSLENRNIISTSNTVYNINFHTTKSNCNGVVCKNGVTVIPRSTTCPNKIINFTKSIVQLIYESQENCDKGYYRAEIWLKCSEVNLSTIIKESGCKLIIQYPVQEVCSLFSVASEEAFSADSTGLAVGSTVGVVIIAIAITLLVVRKQCGVHCRTRYHTIHGNKETTAIYLKDTKC